MLAFLLVFGLLGGWLLSGRMLAPLTRVTDATRIAANGSLSHRIQLEGRSDEFRELADAFDTMLARLEAHVAEQQRFAANASHELRTPLAITQTLLDVARNAPNRDTGELVDRLHAVNTRAIDLTEALLLLSRADQRSFTPEQVDLSLIADEATETLLPLAEARGLTIETSGDMTPTVGSHALLLQLTTNLVQNAIVHNLPEQGTVWVTTSVHPKSVVLTVENTGEKLTPQLVATLDEPFQRGSRHIRTDHSASASASAWQSSRASPTHTTEPSPSPPEPPAASASRCNYPSRHRTPATDERRNRPHTSAPRLPSAADRQPTRLSPVREPGDNTLEGKDPRRPNRQVPDATNGILLLEVGRELEKYGRLDRLRRHLDADHRRDRHHAGIDRPLRGRVLRRHGVGIPCRRSDGLGLGAIIWGALLMLAGFGLISGQSWARWFTIVVVALNVFAQLGFLGNSQYPLWALTALALNIIVLYALTARWNESEMSAPTRL